MGTTLMPLKNFFSDCMEVQSKQRISSLSMHSDKIQAQVGGRSTLKRGSLTFRMDLHNCVYKAKQKKKYC